MSAYSNAILATSGLVGYWRLGEASGGDVIAATGPNGTIVGGVTLGAAGAITGDPDTAYTFNGSTGYLNLTNNAAFQLTTGSVEFWMKTADAGASYRGLVTKNAAYGLYLQGNILQFYDYGGGADRIAVGIDPTDNAWHHIVATFVSGSVNNTFLYLDSALVLTTTITVSNQNQPVAVASGNVPPEQFYAGSIDEVAIYNAVISPATVTAHYTLGLRGASSSRINQQFQLRPY
jgi:hypothetical protein